MRSSARKSRLTRDDGYDALALLLLLLTLAARSLSLSRAHAFPVFDEVASLDQARGFAARGGAAATAACYARGECRDDNRHPLYGLLLAPLMDGSPGDFARAKLLTLATALLLVLVVYGAGRALAGPGIGLAAAGAVALSWSTALLGQQALADLLFAALYCASLTVLARGVERPAGWAAFGALAGLAFLAKGDGHLLLAAGLACAAWRRRLGRRVWPHAAAALAGFAATASVLLARNARVWGNPFHNVNAKVFWLDDWPSYWRLSADPAAWSEVGPLWYWRGHGLGDALARLARGAGSALSALVAAFGTGPEVLHAGLGAALLALSVLGLRRRWREGGKPEAVAFASAALLLLAAFCWYAPAAGDLRRFMVPIAASLLPFAMLGGADLLRRLVSRPRGDGRARVQAGVAVLALALLVPAAGGLSADPREFWEVPPGWGEACAWLNTRADGSFLLPYESVYSMWSCGRDGRRPYPLLAPAPEIRDRARRFGVRAVLLDRAAGPGGLPLDKCGASDAFGPRSFLGWPRCFHGAEKPSRLLIYAPRCG